MQELPFRLLLFYNRVRKTVLTIQTIAFALVLFTVYPTA